MRLAGVCLLALHVSTIHAEDPPPTNVPEVPEELLVLPPVDTFEETVHRDQIVTTPPQTSAPVSAEQLQDRKAEGMERLGELTERLLQARNARKAREALAESKAQRLREQQGWAAAKATQDATQVKRPVEEKTQLPLEQTQPASRSAVSSAEPPETNWGPSGRSSKQPNLAPVVSGVEGSETTQPTQTTEQAPGNLEAVSADPPTEGDAAGVSSQDQPTIDGPVDRLSLATSLYATGRFEECRKILEAVDRKVLSVENQDWCDFLAASCERKLGNMPEAERRYRTLLGHTKVAWLADATRWWLDHLNEQQKLAGELVELDAKQQTWRTNIDALRDTN